MNKLFFIGLFLIASETFAQNKDSLGTRTIEIVKPYEPTISDAVKIATSPTLKDTTTEKLETKYSFVKRQIPTQFDVDPIPAAKMKGERLDKLYRAYLKLGVGTYSSTLAEAYVNSSRSRDHSIGAHVKHFASGGKLNDVGFSGFSDNSIDLTGKKFLRKHLLGGGLNYNREVLHFYGFNPTDFPTVAEDKDNIRQRFQYLGGNATLKSFYKDSTQLNHDIKASYYNLADLYSVQENNVRVEGEVNKFINKEYLSVRSFVDYNRYRTTNDTIGNALVGITPNIESKGKKWRLRVGLGIYSQVNQTAFFHFYPDAYFKYNVVGDLIIPYAGVTGGVERNTFNILSNENPFVGSNVTLNNSNKKYDIYGGVRGSFSSKTSFNVRASKMQVEGMPLFVLDTTYLVENRFDVIYDTVSVVYFTAEISHQQTEKLKLLLRGDYFIYDTQQELAAWQKPDYKFTLSGFYDLKNKIIVKADVFMVSSRTARSFDPDDGEYLGYDIYAKKLKGFVDANIGVEYRYTKKLSAFINFNNVVSTKYTRWDNYPTQSFSVLGGFTYSFWGR